MTSILWLLVSLYPFYFFIANEASSSTETNAALSVLYILYIYIYIYISYVRAFCPAGGAKHKMASQKRNRLIELQKSIRK